MAAHGSWRHLKRRIFFFLLLLKFVIPLSCCSSFSCCGFFLPIAFIKLRPAFNLRSLRSPSVIKFCAKHLPFFFLWCAFSSLFSLLPSSPSPSASSCCSCHSFKWFVSILVARVLLYIYVFHGTPFQEPVNAANICRLHYDAKQAEGKGRERGAVETCGGLWSLTLCIPAAIDSKAFMQISPKLDSRNSCCSSHNIPSSSRLGKKVRNIFWPPLLVPRTLSCTLNNHLISEIYSKRASQILLDILSKREMSLVFKNFLGDCAL